MLVMVFCPWAKTKFGLTELRLTRVGSLPFQLTVPPVIVPTLENKTELAELGLVETVLVRLTLPEVVLLELVVTPVLLEPAVLTAPGILTVKLLEEIVLDPEPVTTGTIPLRGCWYTTSKLELEMVLDPVKAMAAV